MPVEPHDYGRALVSCYEIFMEHARVVDLPELKEKGYTVMEIPFTPSPDEWDKLLVLSNKDKVINGSCSLVIDKTTLEPKVNYLTSLETKEYMRKIRAASSASLGASNTKTRRMN